MLIIDLLNKLEQEDTIMVEADVNLLQTAQLLAQNGIGAMPVVDHEDNLVGVISERDIVKAFAENTDAISKKTVSQTMSTDVIGCSKSDTIHDAREKLKNHKIRHLPVVEDGKILALLSIRDFLMFE